MSSTIEQKRARAFEANKVILYVSQHGRRFFYNERFDRTAVMYVDYRGRIWFQDDYTNTPIYTHYQGRWRKFSHGGTLKRLIIALRDYIRTGEPISPRYFGPWDKMLCDGDLWGYGFEAMENVRRKVLTTEAVRKPLPHLPASAVISVVGENRKDG